jgi:uncharacterized protein (DUF924 family)
MIDDVLSFWFGDVARTREEWFRKSDAFDAEIRARFAETIESAARGELDWESTPRGCLALVIVLDQFSRNAFRGAARSFAQDDRARVAALRAIDAGVDMSLSPLERSFLYMPLMHAEDRSVQARSVALFETLAREAPSGVAEYLKSAADFARKHSEIVERFGRFPHRNAILGRVSTAEEAVFLEQPGSAF